MPRPIPIPLRQIISRRWQRGQSTAAIAQALGLPLRTVRRFVARFRVDGPEAVATAYAAAFAHTPARQRLLEAALQMRRDHPQWGAGLIRIELAMQQAPGPTMPCERTLQRWFRQAGLGPAPKGRRPPVDTRRAERPHEVWQMDAKEQVPLRDGQRVSWLRISDEHTGAILWTKIFPPGLLGTGRGQRCAG
jgi:transposase